METWNRRRMLAGMAAAGAAGTGLGAVGNACAQEAVAAYPSRPIKLLVGFEAGGTPDTIARYVFEAAGRRLGQPFIVDNRAGANGMISTDALLRAPADGYTLLVATTSIVVNPSVYRKISYDLDTDLAPVGCVAMGDGYVLIVNPGLKVRTLAEFLAHCKRAAGKVTFSSPGIGNTLHLAAQTLCDAGGVAYTHVPYKGAAPALNAVISGEVDAMLIPPITAVQHIRSGKVLALAFTGESRWPPLPDVPAASETLKGFEASSGWNGLLAHAKAPAPLLDKVNLALNDALTEPKVIEFLAQGSFHAVRQSRAEFGQYLKAERQKYADIVRAARIEPQ